VFEQAFKNIADVLRKEAGCTTELDYTEQSSWLLFLKYLDALETDRATAAALNGKTYAHILDKPYRWASWAAPKDKDEGDACPAVLGHRYDEVYGSGIGLCLSGDCLGRVYEEGRWLGFEFAISAAGVAVGAGSRSDGRVSGWGS
jgi:hypothetical protein